MDKLDPDSDYAYDATNRPLSDHDEPDDVTPRHLIERYAVDSSNLKSIGYERGQCVIEFTTGHLYCYMMTTTEFDDFAAAESKGRYFNQYIRGQVAGEKLTGQCSQCQASPAVIVVACPDCGGVVRAVDKIHKDPA